MTYSLWVTLYICERQCHSSHVFILPKGSEQHWTFCDKQSNHIISYDHSLWVAWYSSWNTVSSHIVLWPTVGEWHCTFCERKSCHIFLYDQQRVSDIAHFVSGSLITSFPMTKRRWVVFHMFWNAVPSHLFLWSKGGECYDKHALRADAPIPRMFFSPLVLWRYSTYAWLIRTLSFHYDSTSCITPCLTLVIVLLIYDTLFPCSSYVSPLFTNTVCP